MRMTALHCISFLVLGLSVPVVSGAQDSTNIAKSPVASPAAATMVFSDGDRRFLSMAAAGVPPATEDQGADLYKSKCAMCHGPDRAGMVPVFPTLIGVTKKLTDADIAGQIKNGRGKMPPVPGMSDEDIASVILFLKTPPKP